MRQIYLRKRRLNKRSNIIALVDDEDYERLNQYKWCLHKSSENCFYAFRARRITDTSTFTKVILLHREVLNFPNSKIDHIDHNGLNCQKYNLRLATQQQNIMNSSKRKNTSSKYKGVSWHKVHNYWVASIKINGKSIHLGSNVNEISAAELYNKAAIRYFGEFANLNIIENGSNKTLG